MLFSTLYLVYLYANVNTSSTAGNINRRAFFNEG